MAERMAADLELGGHRFTFDVWRRELDFGSAGRAPYYWMDRRLFRRKNPSANFRACVDFWWTAVDSAGAAGVVENQQNLVLAECFPLVSTTRSLQDMVHPTFQWVNVSA